MAGTSQRALIQCPIYVGQSAAVETKPRVSFEDALRANSPSPEVKPAVVGADDSILPAKPAQPVREREQAAPEAPLQSPQPNNPTQIVAAQITATPSNADSKETPHPSTTAGAVSSPWGRANEIQTATVVELPTSDDELAAQIRAAIGSEDDVADPGDNSEVSTSSTEELPTKAVSFELSQAVVSKTPAIETAAPEDPVETWTANPGDYLTTALEAWADKSGWAVQNHSGSIWKITVPVKIEGTFEEAVSELVRGFQRSSPRPEVTSYPNQILIIRRSNVREANNDQ